MVGPAQAYRARPSAFGKQTPITSPAEAPEPDAAPRHKHKVLKGIALGLTLVPTAMLASDAAAPPPPPTMVPTETDISAWQSTQAAPSTPVTTILQANLPAWDHHTGLLTPSDINAQMSNPANTGNKAAAVAFLEDWEDANHFQADLTPQMIGNYDKAYAAGTYTDWDDAYQQDQSNLAAEQSAGLYLHGAPQLSDLAQGDFGDCYFLSALGGLWARSPATAASMVHVQPNGDYVVKLPGYHGLKFTLTQSELAYAASGQPGAQAQIVMEKADGLVRGQSDPIRFIEGGENNAFDTASNGGAGAFGIMLLTGNQVHTQMVHSGGYSLDQMRQDLADNLPQNLVTATTTTSVNGVPGNHCLAVLNYDPQTDTVTVWNPWGSEPANSNVTQVGHGVFTMKADVFYNTFQTLDFQIPGTHAQVNAATIAQADANSVGLGTALDAGVAGLVAAAAVTAAVLVYRGGRAADRELHALGDKDRQDGS